MIAVIDSGYANINSVVFALQRLQADVCVTSDAEKIKTADKVIFPGVGTAKAAMESLQKYSLLSAIKACQQPFLGICLGMQLLYDSSSEGNVGCLGLIPGAVQRLPEGGACIPHMGWNRLEINKLDPLLAGLSEQAYFYYVHSYAASKNQYCLATTDYATEFSAVVRRNNFYGTQFHPERSGDIGEQLLKNFIGLKS